MVRGFQAMQTSRILAPWQWDGGFSAQDVSSSLATIRSRSRDMAKNSPHMRKFLNLCAVNIVGEMFAFKSTPHDGKPGALVLDQQAAKIIEDNSGKDIQEIEDREGLRHVEAAVQALQAEANGVSIAPSLSASTLQGGSPPVEISVAKGELARAATSNGYQPFAMQRPDLVRLFKLMDGNRLRMEMVLMTEVDYDDVLQWTVEDFGDKLQSETTVDGYKYNTLLGRPYTRTIKTDILRPGNIYGFAKPEFLGKFYVLNNTKFYIDKVANLITWQAWEDIAIGIVNIAAIRKLELYSGDATVNDADSIRSYVIPKDEEDLGAINNKVDKGLHFPQVSQF